MDSRSKSIWKFTLEITDHQIIQMPKDAELLHVGLDPQGTPCLWALVTPTNETQGRSIIIHGTGHPVLCVVTKHDNYIGTFVQGRFVWHVFS